MFIVDSEGSVSMPYMEHRPPTRNVMGIKWGNHFDRESSSGTENKFDRL